MRLTIPPMPLSLIKEYFRKCEASGEEPATETARAFRKNNPVNVKSPVKQKSVEFCTRNGGKFYIFNQ